MAARGKERLGFVFIQILLDSIDFGLISKNVFLSNNVSIGAFLCNIPLGCINFGVISNNIFLPKIPLESIFGLGLKFEFGLELGLGMGMGLRLGSGIVRNRVFDGAI